MTERPLSYSLRDIAAHILLALALKIGTAGFAVDILNVGAKVHELRSARKAQP